MGPFCDAHDLGFKHGGRMPGSTHAGKLLNVDRKRWSTHQMVPIFEYPILFEGIDIGLVPLSDKPFNYSKSAIKGMEYTAAGVPFIAARTPEYQWLYKEHNVGRTAKNPADWKKHLTQLLDPSVRAEDRQRNRENVKALDINNTWPDWLDFYKSLT
jgi:glycosyltransferase involved in cell wall biosynthesis